MPERQPAERNTTGDRDMKNIIATRAGNILTLVIDLSKTQGRSKSGNSEIIATTSGNTTIEGGGNIKMGINIYK